MSALVRRMTRLCSIALPLLLILGLTCFGVFAAEELPSEGEETVSSPWGIYVGSTAVTEENCDDILGDTQDDPDAVPHATYNSDKKILTLQNLTLSDGIVSEGNYYSVVCADESVTVQIKGTVTLKWGIYLKKGDVELSQADVTFLGEEGGTGYIQLSDGDLTIESSTVRGESLAGVSDVCFGANRLLISDSRVLVTPARGKSTMFGCVLYAKEKLTVEKNSFVQYQTSYPIVNAFLESEGDIAIKDSVLQATGATYFINSTGGSLTVESNSSLIANECLNGLYLAGNATITDSLVDIRAYQSGILNNPEGGTYFRLKRSTVKVVNPGFEAFENGPLFRQWEEQEAYLSTIYSSYEDYIAKYAEEYTAVTQTIRHSGFYANASDVTFTRSTFTAQGYQIGILYRSAGKHMSVTDGSTLELSGTRAAFMALVNQTSEVRFGSSLKGNATQFSLPAQDILGSYGNYMVSLTPRDVTLKCMTNTPLTDPEQIFDAFGGYVSSCHVTVDEFPVMAIVIPCSVLFVMAVVTVAVFLVRRKFGTDRSKRMNQKEKN
jgi:hypothetical protein